jgi:RING finger protein 113A
MLSSTYTKHTFRDVFMPHQRNSATATSSHLIILQAATHIPMFRKPKKAKKAGIRSRRPTEEEENDDDDLETTRQELLQSRKKSKRNNGGDEEDEEKGNKGSALHHFDTATSKPSQKDLATSTQQHHPTSTKVRANKFLAGPIRAASNIRTTSRFDYQPDICKDYKDTGFCGFGDTCIYLHDRGDQLSGWQLDQKWEEEQQQKKDAQQKQVEEFLKGGKKTQQVEHTEDGMPFACHLCRNFFNEPIVTNCGHYFCQSCLLEHLKMNNTLCPVCTKDTAGVFHEPTKLMSKKRKLVGKEATWQEFLEKCQGTQNEDDEDN